MAVVELSSNWRALQKTLEGEKRTSSKRGALSGAPPAKRHKPNSSLRRMSQATALNGPSGTAAQRSTGYKPSAGPEDLPDALLTPTVALPSDVLNGGLTASASPGKYVALDCEMVGVGPTPERHSALARVSVVDFHGVQVYDSFVATKEPVTDYRTPVSGITAALLRGARPFEQVQRDVAGLLQGKVLVGHALRNDLQALMLGHPKRDVRDTSAFDGYRQMFGTRRPALRMLARRVLGVEIQAGEHSSVEDARVTMALFRRRKDEFERDGVRRFGVGKSPGKQGAEGDGAGEGEGTMSNSVKKKKKKKKKGRK